MTDLDSVQHVATLTSPTGRLVVYGTTKAITAVAWSDAPIQHAAPKNSPVAEAVHQIEAYFQRRLQRFDLPLAPGGSSFQARVWGALCSIPFGETASYGEIARRIGSAARPVGMACGANPIPILIPCHRVVAADGRLTGFSGGDGISTKQLLLDLEDLGQADLFGTKTACYDPAPSARRYNA